jgi:hypothetical protein
MPNDTLLYASSWKYRNISSFSYQNMTWKYQPFRNMAAYDNYSHITVDEFGRFLDYLYCLFSINQS